jgi:hypothetical protein
VNQLDTKATRVGAQHRARQQHDARAGHLARHQVDGRGAGQHDAFRRHVQVHRAQRARELLGHVLGVVGEQHEALLQLLDQRCCEGKRRTTADQCAVKIDEVRAR